ncbi:hypothetical protein DFJ74DRAFT_759090 [Hyaloraphidium curvatum]|nr:hypothetical protein DFJ74DRAFT_759090 [Hyaloraphidium curvatum]
MDRVDKAVDKTIDGVLRVFGRKKLGGSSGKQQQLTQAQYDALMQQLSTPAPPPPQGGRPSSALSAGAPSVSQGSAAPPRNLAASDAGVDYDDDDYGASASENGDAVPYPRTHSLQAMSSQQSGSVAAPPQPAAAVPMPSSSYPPAPASVRSAASLAPPPAPKPYQQPVPTVTVVPANAAGQPADPAQMAAMEERARQFEERAAYLREHYGIDSVADDEASSVMYPPSKSGVPEIAVDLGLGTQPQQGSSNVNLSQQTLMANSYSNPYLPGTNGAPQAAQTNQGGPSNLAAAPNPYAQRQFQAAYTPPPDPDSPPVPVPPQGQQLRPGQDYRAASETASQVSTNGGRPPLPPMPPQHYHKDLPPSPQPSESVLAPAQQQLNQPTYSSQGQLLPPTAQQVPVSQQGQTYQAPAYAAAPPAEPQRQRPTMQSAAGAVMAAQYMANSRGARSATASENVSMRSGAPSNEYDAPASATPSQLAQLEQLTRLLEEKEKLLREQQQKMATMQRQATQAVQAAQMAQAEAAAAAQSAAAAENGARAASANARPERPTPPAIITQQPRPPPLTTAGSQVPGATPGDQSDGSGDQLPFISTHVNGEDIPYKPLPNPTVISQSAARQELSKAKALAASPGPPSNPPAIDTQKHPPDLSFRIRVPGWSTYWPGKRHKLVDGEAGGWRWRVTLYPKGRQGCRPGFNCSIEVHCVSYEGDFSDRTNGVEARFQFVVDGRACITKQGPMKAGSRWGMDTVVEASDPWGWDDARSVRTQQDPPSAPPEEEDTVTGDVRFWYGPFKFPIPDPRDEGIRHPLTELHRFFPSPGGNLADLTLRVGEKNYYVHRMVLGLCSDFFKNLLDFGPSEPLVDQTILFRSLRPEIMEIILDYIYNTEYALPSGMPWRTLAELFAACETYQIPHLQQMVIRRLHPLFDSNNIVPLYLLARKTENRRLQRMITDYVTHNYAKLKEHKSQLVATMLRLPEQDATQVRKLLDALLEAAEKYQNSTAADRTAQSSSQQASAPPAAQQGPTPQPQRPRAIAQPSSARTAGERIGWSSGTVYSADGPRPGLRNADALAANRLAAARWLGNGFS